VDDLLRVVGHGRADHHPVTERLEPAGEPRRVRVLGIAGDELVPDRQDGYEHMASMTIREIDPERDAEQVVDLVVKTNPIAVTNPEEWRHRIRAVPERTRSLFRVAILGDSVVGLLEAGLEFFGSGELARFGIRVDPGYRRRGIGSELYEQGLAHIRSLG